MLKNTGELEHGLGSLGGTKSVPGGRGVGISDWYKHTFSKAVEATHYHAFKIPHLWQV